MDHDFALQSSLHTAIIMDGNGRWALARGWPRVAGHRAGADSVRRVVEAIAQAEAATAGGSRLRLRIAVDYSGRESIVRAARQLPDPTPESLARLLGPPVDLLIRTGGEQRLSDFLLWECAYAELIFSRRMWPDFDKTDLESAVAQFRARERRFGTVPVPQRTNGRSAWLD